MNRPLFLAVLLGLAGAVHAQEAARQLSPDERAFLQLPADLQSMLATLPPREALLKVQLAQQHLIAVGNPNASGSQLRAMVQNVLAPQGGGYSVTSSSAGSTSFPPMSQLVAPYLPTR